MKKISAIALLVIISTRVNAQTLTFKDLLSMTTMQDAGAFLTDKGFEKTNSQGTLLFFVKNPNTPQSERVTFDTKYKSPGYTRRDVNFMKAMAEEAGKSFHLMIKDDSAGLYYQYSDGKLNIVFDIKHGFGMVSIAPQGAK